MDATQAEGSMHSIGQGWRGLRFVIWMNADRLACILVLALGLGAGAVLGNGLSAP